MLQVNLKNLIERLNPYCKKSLESAAGMCLSRTNYNVELEHWLAKLVDDSQSDMALCLRAYDVDMSQLQRDITRAIDRFKTGNAKSPALSPDVVDWVREAYVLATIDYASAGVTSGHLLCALLGHEPLARAASGASKEFEKVPLESLRKNLWQLTSDSLETRETPSILSGSAAGPTGTAAGKPSAGGPSRTPALDQFTIDLTQRARDKQIDPVLGRDNEIRQLVDILTRRRQNNPILTGEAGVGKTAVVEGFALHIASGNVPAALKEVTVRTLDLGLLQAGAGMKGEFENRLKSVIDEVKASPKPIILFIDEAHTLIGAGGSAGQGDAANLLKPALARGELRTIAATTWAEYKKYFEKDAALARRFQVVKVEEPSEAVAVDMIRGLTDTLQRHHRVRILDEALVDAVKLSSRYISGRQLPDKAVSLLDTTCARIGISQASSPPAMEDAQRKIEQLKTTLAILRRESATGTDHTQRIAELQSELQATQTQLQELEARWQRERELVKEIAQLASELEAAAEASEQPATKPGEQPLKSGEQPGKAGPPPAAKAGEPVAELSPEQLAHKLAEYQAKTQELRGMQGEQPLVHPCVDCQAVAETVASWTGIPVGRMVANEIQTVLKLSQLMEEQIVGQTHALNRIAQSIRTSRAQLSDPRTPIGVFLLAGTSGVGKTETAITLAELLYGGEQNMTTINMSEFKEEHKVSLLMGSPPGYVGYGEGGVLTEAVRRKPYSVLLFDEMEKAHPGVQDIFYQVFDKGTMKDGEGRDIDFKNTVILMTTNAGTDLIKSLCADPETAPEPEAFLEAIFPELLKTFKPAFLGRTTVIPYYPLSDDVLRRIVRLKLGKVAKRVAENYGASFSYEPELIDTIVQRCTEVDTGARNIDHILTRSLLPELSSEFLSHLAEGREISSVHVGVGDQQAFRYEIA